MDNLKLRKSKMLVLPFIIKGATIKYAAVNSVDKYGKYSLVINNSEDIINQITEETEFAVERLKKCGFNDEIKKVLDIMLEKNIKGKETITLNSSEQPISTFEKDKPVNVHAFIRLTTYQDKIYGGLELYAVIEGDYNEL